MHGPESHNYASWEKYVVIRDEYNRNMAYLEEIEKGGNGQKLDNITESCYSINIMIIKTEQGVRT